MNKKYSNENTYKYYISASTERVKDYLHKVIEEDNKSPSSFTAGERTSFYWALEVLRNNAIEAGLPLKEIGLEEENPV